MSKRVYLYKVIGLLVGIFIFVYNVDRFGGLTLIFEKLKLMKYFYLFIIANSFAWMLFYTQAWRWLFCEVKERIKFLPLLRIKLSGEAVNFMTPLGFVAGDPVRVLLLRKLVGSEARLRSVVVDRVIHIVSAQIFNLCGIIVLLTQGVNFPLWLNALLLFLYATLSLFFVSVIVSMLTGKGLGWFENIFTLLKLPVRLPTLHSKIMELKDDLDFYHDRSKKPIIMAFSFHFLGRVLGAVEILIAVRCFVGEFHLAFAFVLTALTSFFSFAFGFIPGALGVLEGLYASFFALYGLKPDDGITVQIVRRLRVLFWLAIGMLILEYEEIAHYFKKHKEYGRLGQ